MRPWGSGSAFVSTPTASAHGPFAKVMTPVCCSVTAVARPATGSLHSGPMVTGELFQTLGRVGSGVRNRASGSPMRAVAGSSVASCFLRSIFLSAFLHGISAVILGTFLGAALGRSSAGALGFSVPPNFGRRLSCISGCVLGPVRSPASLTRTWSVAPPSQPHRRRVTGSVPLRSVLAGGSRRVSEVPVLRLGRQPIAPRLRCMNDDLAQLGPSAGRSRRRYLGSGLARRELRPVVTPFGCAPSVAPLVTPRRLDPGRLPPGIYSPSVCSGYVRGQPPARQAPRPLGVRPPRPARTLTNLRHGAAANSHEMFSLLLHARNCRSRRGRNSI